jgi:hypothetical protein
MSLEKAIKYNKEYRKQYRGAKSFACSCRNHGGCGYCNSNRMIFDKKARLRLEGQVDEWFGYWNYADPSCVNEDVTNEALEKIGVDPWDFAARRELDV